MVLGVNDISQAYPEEYVVAVPEYNLVLRVPMAFQLNAEGQPLHPLQWIQADDVLESTKLDFGDAQVVLTFGDFWKNDSQSFFRPLNPRQAKHMLLRVEWQQKPTLLEQLGESRYLLFYHQNKVVVGEGGTDYMVLPMGFYLRAPEDERMGSGKQAFESYGYQYRQKYAELMCQALAQNDKALRQKRAREGLPPHLVRMTA